MRRKMIDDWRIDGSVQRMDKHTKGLSMNLPGRARVLCNCAGLGPSAKVTALWMMGVRSTPLTTQHEGEEEDRRAARMGEGEAGRVTDLRPVEDGTRGEEGVSRGLRMLQRGDARVLGETRYLKLTQSFEERGRTYPVRRLLHRAVRACPVG
jgi:hypothetical protein